MSNLPITDLKIEQALKRDFSNSQISLKVDGSLISYKDGKLFSPRCERSSRYSHILNILKEHNCPNLTGEIFLDKKGTNVFDVSRSENWKNLSFMPFKLDDSKLSFEEQRVLLKQLVSEIANPKIVPLKEFSDIPTAWNYVKENESEGIVIKDNHNWFKVKMKKERFLYFNNYELHSDGKGITLTDGLNRVNCGGKEKSQQAIKDIKEKGNVKVEIEFMNYTEDGKMFQPFVRRVVKIGEEKE